VQSSGWGTIQLMPLGVLIYVAGMVIGLFLTDAPPARRVALAAAWPLGPIAAVVTIASLVGASLVLFPFAGLTVAALAGLWWVLT
jgi:hypothetical protein